MSNLVLELRQGEVMIVNGAPIRFRTKSRIELTAKARFLFGKQIMAPEQVDSPARRIYFALQSAYIGNEAERERRARRGARLHRRFQGGDDIGTGPDNPGPRPGRGRSRRLLPGAEARAPHHPARRCRARRERPETPPFQTGTSDCDAERNSMPSKPTQTRLAPTAPSASRRPTCSAAPLPRSGGARSAGPIPRVRALADNRRLWMTVLDLMRDPANALPEPLRASIISVGLAVQREMDAKRPTSIS